ncbi:MAG: hypothetical protein KGL39_26420 [Patescibacteria group bacterium]|nr:hypothetical protein [Patescibacteria group bacterium]
MKKLTWKKWRVGLALSITLGCLSAGAGLAAGISWKGFTAVLCTSLLTHIGAYLTKSPLDQVDDGDAAQTEPNKP